MEGQSAGFRDRQSHRVGQQGVPVDRDPDRKEGAAPELQLHVIAPLVLAAGGGYKRLVELQYFAPEG